MPQRYIQKLATDWGMSPPIPIIPVTSWWCLVNFPHYLDKNLSKSQLVMIITKYNQYIYIYAVYNMYIYIYIHYLSIIYIYCIYYILRIPPSRLPLPHGPHGPKTPPACPPRGTGVHCAGVRADAQDGASLGLRPGAPWPPGLRDSPWLLGSGDIMGIECMFWLLCMYIYIYVVCCNYVCVFYVCYVYVLCALYVYITYDIVLIWIDKCIG